MRRHIVLVHRYFTPDTPPYAAILGDLAEFLGEEGNRVTVLTCQPSYNRRVVGGAPPRETPFPNVTVIRFPVLDDRTSSLLKIVNLVWFCGRLVGSFKELRGADVVMAASSPPVLVAATSCLLARMVGAGFVYHKQDIYPEVTVGLGASSSALFARMMRSLDTRTDRRSRRVVVLSSDMAETVMGRGVPADRIRVLNNFDPWGDAADEQVDTAARDEGSLNVVFAGNLGRFQGLEILFAAMIELREEAIRFHIFGQGPLSAELEDMVRRESLAHVSIYGYRSPIDVATFLGRSADLGVVSLAPGVIRAAYPSKTLSYLRRGTPILALVEGDSELARMVSGEAIGRQVDPGDLAGLVSTLRELSQHPEELIAARERARTLYERDFSRERRLSDWKALFQEVSA